MTVSINLRRQYEHHDTASDLIEKFTKQLGNESSPFTLQIASNLITFKVKSEDAKWWSPEMNLRIESENNKSIFYELIGPNPATFTLAMFFIFFGAVVFLAAFIMMMAQIQIGMSSTLASVGSGLSILVIVFAFAGLAYGRMQAKEQVEQLREVAQRIINPSE